MLKTLRRKFIIISLVLACLVLTIVVAVSIISLVNNYNERCDIALGIELNRTQQGDGIHYFFDPSSDEYNERNRTSEKMLSFSVIVDTSGSWYLSTPPWVKVNEDYAKSLVDEVVLRNENSGYIPQDGIRYEVGQSRIAFVSVQSERIELRTNIIVWCVTYIFAVLAFLAICVFLSGWSLRPVETAWKQQQQFIADASHEIKTPLTVILANTDIMEKEQGTNVWLSSTRSEALHMKQLVEDMLFLARSDAARPEIPHTAVSLSDIVWEITLAFEAVAYEKNVTMHSEIMPECTVTGDERLLRQLVSILLDNAVKYTETGGSVHVVLTQKKQNYVLSVINTGEIKDKQQLAHLFDRFYRADDSRVRNEGGYGLGLAIAREIAEQHHGNMHVSSSSGEIVFSFTISEYK